MIALPICEHAPKRRAISRTVRTGTRKCSANSSGVVYLGSNSDVILTAPVIRVPIPQLGHIEGRKELVATVDLRHVLKSPDLIDRQPATIPADAVGVVTSLHIAAQQPGKIMFDEQRLASCVCQQRRVHGLLDTARHRSEAPHDKSSALLIAVRIGGVIRNPRDGRRNAPDTANIEVGKLSAIQKLGILGREGERLPVCPTIENQNAARRQVRVDFGFEFVQDALALLGANGIRKKPVPPRA